MTRRSAERPLALAVDVGTSAVRAMIHDRRGRPVRGAIARAPYEFDADADGSITVPAALLLRRVETAIDVVATRARPLLEDVRVAGVSCFLHSLVGCDDTGRPVSPVMSWADTRSAAAARHLRSSLDAGAIHRRTGAPLHPGYWPARIADRSRHEPRIHRWSGFPELLLGHLTGHAVAGVSVASATGLYHRGHDDWDAELLDALRIDARTLPPIVEDDVPLGTLAGEAAMRWPSLRDAVWFPAWGDGACGNVGLGCVGADRAAVMVGTSSAMRVVVRGGGVAPPPGLFAFRLGRDRSLLGGQLSEGGGTVAWLARLLGRSVATLERAAGVNAGSRPRPTVLPYPAGERGVGYHDAARAAFSGMSAATTPADLYLATLDAVALGLASVDRRLSSALAQSPAVIAAGGAVARSPRLLETIAGAMGRPVERATVIEPSARGAALLALHAAGGADPGTLPPASSTVVPDPGEIRRLDEALGRQDELYRALLGEERAADGAWADPDARTGDHHR